jgi:rhodanese-related sulfurtransferase
MVAIPEISVDELDDLLRGDGVHLLDVREEWEFRRRRVPGAVSAPLAQLAGRIAELPRDKPIAVICEHGHRSLAAPDYLRGRGFENVFSVQGGTDAWARSNRPVERD